MARQQGLYAYDDRYRRVFDAGAIHWNDPEPNSSLARVLDQLPRRSRCVEFGCGEGYQARFIASRGHSVTAIDLSPTVIAKAIRETPPGLRVRFIVGDVTDPVSLDLPPSCFQLAVNIGCLHMMANDEDRAAHLGLIHRALVSGGKLFLQNGLDPDDVTPASAEERHELAEIREHKALAPGHPVQNTIVTAEGPRTLMLPLCPACRMLSLDGYVRELADHGFRILSAERRGSANCSFEAVILAERP